MLHILAQGAASSTGALGSSTEVDDQLKLVRASDKHGEFEPDMLVMKHSEEELQLETLDMTLLGSPWKTQTFDQDTQHTSCSLAMAAIKHAGLEILDLVDHSQQTALEISARFGVTPVLEAMLHARRGAAVHCKLSAEVGPTVRCGLNAATAPSSILNAALQQCAVNPYPPFVASWHGQCTYIIPGAEHTAQLLIDAQADLNAVDQYGQTALQIAMEVIDRAWGAENIRHEYESAVCDDYQTRYILDILAGATKDLTGREPYYYVETPGSWREPRT